MAGLRDARNYDPAGTHAECEHVASAPGIQRVVGRSENRFVLGLPVLVAVDLLLWLFDSQAELKRLLFHRNTGFEERLIRVPRAVTDRENHSIGGNETARRLHAPESIVNNVDAFQSAGKPVLAAEFFDASPEITDDHRQPVAAQMRAAFVNDVWLAAAVGEAFEHPVDIGADEPTSQFHVAERARSAFSEQVVVLLLESFSRVESANRGDSLFDGVASFDNQRAEPFSAR